MNPRALITFAFSAIFAFSIAAIAPHVVVSAASALVPTQSGNGDDEEPGPPSTTSDTTVTGDGGNGSHRGHETYRIKTAIIFLITREYPDILRDLAYGNRSRTLSDSERALICRISRVRLHDEWTLLHWLPAYLASTLDRPESMVQDALADC